MHQATRSKKLLDLLHGFGVCVEYTRILRLETQLATSVIEAKRLHGAYLPSTMKKGTFTCFAVDNSDFNEDTPDGKRTLHATATAVYQRRVHGADNDNTCPMELHGNARDRSLKSVAATKLVSYSAPKSQSVNSPTFADFKTGSNKGVIMPFHTQDTSWFLSRAIMRTDEVGDDQSTDNVLSDMLNSRQPSDNTPPEGGNSQVSQSTKTQEQRRRTLKLDAAGKTDRCSPRGIDSNTR